MCAARVGEDPRPGAPSIEEMMDRSAVIVTVLLAHGADVNTVEKAGGNTALHLAVLSENLAAVEALASNAQNLDITLRNEAGNTALDVSKRISGVVSVQMEDLLSLKWAEYENKAAQISAKVEQELMDLALKEDGADRTQLAKTGSRKSKKAKKKGKASASASKISQAKAHEMEQNPTEVSNNKHVKANPASVLPSNAATEIPGAVSEIEDIIGRKEASSDKSKTLLNPSKSKTQHISTVNVVKKNPQPPRPAAPPQTTQKLDSSSSNTVTTTTSTGPSAPWSMQNNSTSSSKKASEFMSPRSQKASDDDSDEDVASSNISFDFLNGSFQRTFPVAADLEIGVEKFLIASSVSDRELEPNDNLSISQVEALQEAHWQAYHYLNEKKVSAAAFCIVRYDG
ncbi:unnamed protein product [Phytophthora fragariaefolia]|uniref:Unnamed protein product n=1 Tax=Phytophthora fragariaefolia TaxID=1490495 RepID=A0A9W6YJ96_9STRA|nr:unnamed protein product [Phytophthora fragariaefolia]